MLAPKVADRVGEGRNAGRGKFCWEADMMCHAKTGLREIQNSKRRNEYAMIGEEEVAAAAKVFCYCLKTRVMDGVGRFVPACSRWMFD